MISLKQSAYKSRFSRVTSAPSSWSTAGAAVRDVEARRGGAYGGQHPLEHGKRRRQRHVRAHRSVESDRQAERAADCMNAVDSRTACRGA
jgi:hypothetical protein